MPLSVWSEDLIQLCFSDSAWSQLCEESVIRVDLHGKICSPVMSRFREMVRQNGSKWDFFPNISNLYHTNWSDRRSKASSQRPALEPGRTWLGSGLWDVMAPLPQGWHIVVEFSCGFRLPFFMRMTKTKVQELFKQLGEAMVSSWWLSHYHLHGFWTRFVSVVEANPISGELRLKPHFRHVIMAVDLVCPTGGLQPKDPPYSVDHEATIKLIWWVFCSTCLWTCGFISGFMWNLC